jgi:tRNA (guanine37-N1)-methyltransferase
VIVDVLTLFPEIFDSFLSQSLLAKALAKNLLTVNILDIRAHAKGPHRTADDRPYGGGPGMVLKPEPLAGALDALLGSAKDRPLIINLTPSGRLFTQDLARELSEKSRLALICGRYEGIDQRALDLYADLHLSIGDYVLSGGEVPAMVVIEAVARLIPGFMGREDSPLEESHGYGLLEHPIYTRPRVWRGLSVPKVLLSGDHAQIAAFRLAESVDRTRKTRPELLERADLPERLAKVLERPGAPLEGKRRGAGGPRPKKLRASDRALERNGSSATAQSRGSLADDASDEAGPSDDKLKSTMAKPGESNEK